MDAFDYADLLSDIVAIQVELLSWRGPVQSQKRIFDDIAKVAGGALGALGSLKQEIEGLVRQRVDKFMADNDLISREEFEAVKAMASEARVEQERLIARIAKLESSIAASKKTRSPATKAKAKAPARKKAAAVKKPRG